MTLTQDRLENHKALLIIFAVSLIGVVILFPALIVVLIIGCPLSRLIVSGLHALAWCGLALTLLRGEDIEEEP